MKILCSNSSIEFDCSHFPGTFYSRELIHPIFYLPQKRLLSYTKKWASGELTPTDSYLLFLALLNSSEQIDFRVPVYKNEHTDRIVALNMEPLVLSVIKLNTVRNPAVTFPRFVITPETRFLTNVHHWIECWNDAYQSFQDGYRSAHESRKLITRESALQRMIKNPHKNIASIAQSLADWAETAGEFPQFLTQSPWNSIQIPCSEYWKALIVRAAKDQFLHSVPAKDLQELLDHCEENIPPGTIYSHELFKLLRRAAERQKNYLGFGDIDLRSTYSMLEDGASAESANMKAMIDSAPLEEPKPEQYPTKFKYIQAKLKWDMAKKYGADSDKQIVGNDPEEKF